MSGYQVAMTTTKIQIGIKLGASQVAANHPKAYIYK